MRSDQDDGKAAAVNGNDKEGAQTGATAPNNAVGGYLVVSRKVGEEIWIGDDIHIVIKKAAGSTTKLAICAPRSLVVKRGEARKITHGGNK